MGIHLVDRTFEIRGASGLGASPRPELVGPVLSRLHDTLVDSVRMGFLHSSRYDHGLLHRFASYRSALKRGVESIRIDGDVSAQAQIDPMLVAAADSLRCQTPPSRRVRLCGKLDMLGVSRKVMGLYLEDGTPVTALWNTEGFAGLAGFLDKDVVIEGLAVFRPSGRLLRIDADAIDAAGSRDSYFSTLPLPGAMDYAAVARARPGNSPYKDLLGMIPGEESDEEFLKALAEAV